MEKIGIDPEKIENVLLTHSDVDHCGGVKVEVIDVPGHTIGHICYIVDDKILFSGDCLAVNAQGGYSLFDFFTQNPTLNKKSLIQKTL
ncbi:MAG: MBL fold metallo-hydrolase [Lachnospiraceae bacterium]|nr:MBL fold metallo-hydrolase [Lachnospiraceae bacterium]